jgi:hypothetical protein
MQKEKTKIIKPILKSRVFIFFLSLWILTTPLVLAQAPDELEFIFDFNSNTTPLPKIFKPNIDLSGRGINWATAWPQGLADAKVLEKWKSDIGFSGMYRLQYNLWEINQLAEDQNAQGKLLDNYKKIIKDINDSGGVVILDIFGTPAGLGKVLDKKSPPWDLKAFKELVKSHIRDLSCNKRYNIWYEVWSAPDLDSFFLGRKQEYLNLYRQVAEAAKELEVETKIHIPVGGPSVSWWFQNQDGNNIITTERSLIYELIKFCYGHHLPLDFITWHSYSTSPKADQELTVYNKSALNLIRDWLTYFYFNRDIPLIVDEWNYDSGVNVSPERKEKSFIAASYIPSRIKNMHEAGLDYQVYFCLEDFYNKKDGVARNVGAFWFDPEASEYKGGPKSIYNVFKMLSRLSNNMLLPALKVDDEFIGMVTTKTEDGMVIIVYNYIDPEIARNYLSKNIATLSDGERKVLLSLIRSDKLGKIIKKEIDIFSLRLRDKLDALLRKAQELNERADKFKSGARNIKIGIKNLTGYYLYQRYVVDSSCAVGCELIPAEERESDILGPYHEISLSVNPYSVSMILFKKKEKPVENTTASVSGNLAPDTATPADKPTSKPEIREKVSGSSE